MGVRRKDEQRFIEMYQSGIKPKEICKTLKCNKTTLYSILRRNNIATHGIKDWAGYKFNKITFVRPSIQNEIKDLPPNPSGQNHWLCKCDCGREFHSNYIYAIKTGATKSCGKCQHEGMDYRLSSARSVYNITYTEPKDTISFEEFLNLSQQNCEYCGSAPTRTRNVFIDEKNLRKYSQKSKDNGDFVYNGLDRVDPKLPHTLENVVPCCWDCNWAKNNLSLKEFDERFLRLVNNMFEVIL
jgi:hypothetical protein